MSYRATPTLLDELSKYGPVAIESCFNCGNCTAICPLSTETVNFPRRAIRFAQLGFRDRLLGSKELWLCYYCGECTETCPREADPGEFMATARRYATAKYDPSGLSKLLYTKPILSVIFLVLMAILIGTFFYSYRGPMNSTELRLFEFIPSEIIHNAGIISGIMIILAILTGMGMMFNKFWKYAGDLKGTRLNWLPALWKSLGVEVLGQNRYREDCAAEQPVRPWYAQNWFIHASILWGFLGLLVATALNYLLDLIGIKVTGTWVPIWYPIRLLGTVSGLFLLYGTSFAIIKRFRKDETAYVQSTTSDWAFLILMWLSGVTGFLVEIAVYLPSVYSWSYWLLLAHLIVAGEMLLLIPFTKFAHAIYRSIALYFYVLEPLPEKKDVRATAPAEG